jgi:hypothetical protein
MKGKTKNALQELKDDVNKLKLALDENSQKTSKYQVINLSFRLVNLISSNYSFIEKEAKGLIGEIVKLLDSLTNDEL